MSCPGQASKSLKDAGKQTHFHRYWKNHLMVGAVGTRPAMPYKCNTQVVLQESAPLQGGRLADWLVSSISNPQDSKRTYYCATADGTELYTICGNAKSLAQRSGDCMDDEEDDRWNLLGSPLARVFVLCLPFAMSKHARKNSQVWHALELCKLLERDALNLSVHKSAVLLQCSPSIPKHVRALYTSDHRAVASPQAFTATSGNDSKCNRRNDI